MPHQLSEMRQGLSPAIPSLTNQQPMVVSVLPTPPETPFPREEWKNALEVLPSPADIQEVNFRFNITKATDAACWFIQREGGRINIMKLVKLIYLLDRLAVQKRGKPIVGGVYFSMRNGPVTSELLDLINAGVLTGEDDERWGTLISDRRNHEVALESNDVKFENLSPAEVGILEELYAEHGAKDQWQLRDWCHSNCPEWTPLESGREPIQLEDLAKSVGCPEEEVKLISSFAGESNLLRAFLKLA